MQLVDFPKMVADRFQVNEIEPLDEHFESIEGAYFDKFRKALEATGTHVVNIPVGRLHGSFYDPHKDKRTAATSLAHVADYSERKQIVVNLENDDPTSEDAFFLIEVMERAKTLAKGLARFMSMLLNKGESYNYRIVAAIFQHSCTISHVKEIENGKLFRVNLLKVFEIAKKAGFKGHFSMEWDSEGHPYAGTTHLIDETLKALS